MDNNENSNKTKLETDERMKEKLRIPKESYDNSGTDLENEDKPYTLVKVKDKNKIRILNKLLLFFTFVFFALIVIYLYKMMPYK
ncbi:MAG: hypothetical protein IJ068_00980 [Bacilli bacterium]|nr:hypothetical protein [Bacilli bacterium]